MIISVIIIISTWYCVEGCMEATWQGNESIAVDWEPRDTCSGLHSARRALRGLSPPPLPQGLVSSHLKAASGVRSLRGLWDALPPCSDSRGPQGSADTEEQGPRERFGRLGGLVAVISG